MTDDWFDALVSLLEADARFPFLSRVLLLANKRAAGRPKDRADLEALEG